MTLGDEARAGPLPNPETTELEILSEKYFKLQSFSI